MAAVLAHVKTLQCKLGFSSATSPAFINPHSVGRNGVLGLCVGAAFGLSLALSLTTSSTTFLISLYVLFLSSFHALEFLTTALFNPTQVTSTSFVIDHSLEYTCALLSSITELLLRILLAFLFPTHLSPPTFTLTAAVGFLLCLTGQSVRAIAMCTCGDNFNHIIQTEDTTENHKLVKHGIYSFLRHPSYTGWFYWSIGTQVLLGNRINFVGYVFASYKFFKARIPFEENTLVDLFGKEYEEYRNVTWVLIPGIQEGDKKAKVE